jgi:hypothetical protein
MIHLRTILMTLSAAALVSAQAPASAETFTIFIYETPKELALRSSSQDDGLAYWADYAAFANVLQASHAIRSGAPLALPKDGVSFSSAGRRVGVAENDALALSGYFQIDAETLAAAEALAAEAPSVRRGGRADVRASYPAPAMSSPDRVAH